MKISMRLSTRLFFVLIACCLTACADNQPKPQLVVEPQNVTMRLAAAADKASSALDQLAAIEQTRTPVDLPPLASSAPPELRRSITVNWIGPIEPIAKQLADRASYQFNITGNKPATPVVVSLNVRNEPVIEALRDLGLQLGGRAELRVDPNQKVVELSYASIQTGEDLAAPAHKEDGNFSDNHKSSWFDRHFGNGDDHDKHDRDTSDADDHKDIPVKNSTDDPGYNAF